MLSIDKNNKFILSGRYTFLMVFFTLLIFAVIFTPSPQAQKPFPPSPQMDLITPYNCSAIDGVVNFIYDFSDCEDDLEYLEIDILGPSPYDIPINKIQALFTANEADPLEEYNTSEKDLLQNMGVSVSFNEDNEVWNVTINTLKLWNGTNPWGQPNGSAVWPAGIYNFYIEVGDEKGNTFGHSINPPDYSHFVYSFHEIQSLIDIISEGKTLYIYNGNYTENLVINTSDITLKGVSSPLIDGSGSTVVTVNADNITIDGLTIFNASDTDGSETGIYIDGVSKGKMLDNNIYDNNFGIYIHDSDNVTIEGNKVYQQRIPSGHSSYADCTNGGIGISIWSTVGGIGNYHHTINDNVIYNNLRQGIYLGANSREGDDSSITKYNIISNNIIYNNGIAWMTCSGYSGGNEDEFGIHLNAADENKIGPGNEIYNHDKSSAGAGIYLMLSQKNIITSNLNNSAVNLSSSTGIINNNDYGIRLWDDSINNSITSNDLFDNEFGIWINGGVSATDSGVGTRIKCNNIEGNIQYGVAYALSGGASTTINATFNYWGDSTGPHHPVLNVNGTGDQVSDNVNFSNWLGYYWYNIVYVDDYYDYSTPGWNITHFSTINDGIDNVFETGIVEIRPGTFDELVHIDKALTLHSSFGPDVTSITDHGATYSEMELMHGQTVQIACDNVIIDGIGIGRYEYTSYHPMAAVGNIGYPGISNVYINNCHIDSLFTCVNFSNIDGLILTNNSYNAQTDDKILYLNQIQNFLIENEDVSDYNLRGIYLSHGRNGILSNMNIEQKDAEGLILEHCDNITLKQSLFRYIFDKAIVINDTRNTSIINNTFDSCQYGICLNTNSTVSMINNTFDNTDNKINGAAYLNDYDLYYGDIQEAINYAGVGWNISVYPGNFSENIIINKKVEILGLMDVENTKIYGDNKTPTMYIARDNDVDNLVIEGLSINGGNNSIRTGKNRGIEGLIIRDCIIENPSVGKAVFIDPHNYSDIPPIRNGTDIFAIPVSLINNKIRGGVLFHFWTYELYGVEIPEQLYIANNDIDTMYLNGSISVNIIDNHFYSLGMQYSNDILIQGNIFENPWEHRYGIYLWSVNGSPPVKDVRITQNSILSYSSFAVTQGVSGQGIVIAGAMDISINNNEITANTDGIWITEDYENRFGKRCVGDVLDISIRNNDIQNGQTGVKLLSNVDNVRITDNNIQINGKGIWIHGSDDHLIINNTITGNYHGIRFDTGSSNSLVYNNYFAENIINAYDQHSTSNTWNISLTEGTNIMGGPYIGGNYWDDYNGEDTDGDSIGDTLIPYNCSGNIAYGGDYLPIDLADITAPEVELLFPNGGESLNGTITITWSVSDDFDSNPMIDIDYSDNGGLTWERIVTNHDNNGSYKWNTAPLPEGTNYKIRITATDNAGNNNSDSSDGTFSIYLDVPGPTIYITNPLMSYLYFFNAQKARFLTNNCFVFGHIIIEAEVSTLLEIEKVEFLIDNQVVNTSYHGNNGVYSWEWDETALFYHEIKVIAYDIHGATGEDLIGVTIFNFSIIP